MSSSVLSSERQYEEVDLIDDLQMNFEDEQERRQTDVQR